MVFVWARDRFYGAYVSLNHRLVYGTITELFLTKKDKRHKIFSSRILFSNKCCYVVLENKPVAAVFFRKTNTWKVKVLDKKKLHFVLLSDLETAETWHSF